MVREPHHERDFPIVNSSTNLFALSPSARLRKSFVEGLRATCDTVSDGEMIEVRPVEKPKNKRIGRNMELIFHGARVIKGSAVYMHR
jgi:hypothetical protein